MIIYVNPFTNKLSKDKNNSVPIIINSDIDILHEVVNKDLPLFYKLDDGKVVYRNFSNNETTENKSYFITGVNKTIGKLTYNDVHEWENSPVLVKQCMSEIVTVDEDNYDQFDLEQILQIEYQNIVNKTDYQFVVSDILDNIDKVNSSFRSLNKYRCVLNSGDKIVLNLDTVESINNIKIANLDNIFVLINNTVVNDYVCELTTPTNSLSISITNNSNDIAIITNPYLLCK